MIERLFHKIERKWTKICLQPIRVFCLHEISTHPEFPNEQESDWMEIGEFQHKVQQMQQSGVEFISLDQAYELLKASSAPFSTLNSNLSSLFSNLFRQKKYAVLTSDDGRHSLHEILPWLIEHQLPITLFINGKYVDGEEHSVEQYNPFHCLTAAELKHYVEISNGLISLQSHGYEHLDATKMTEEEFKAQIEKNVDYISLHRTQGTIHQTPNTKHQFHAYTWGRHNAQTDAILQENNIIPVLVDGMKNYNDASCIHRELLN